MVQDDQIKALKVAKAWIQGDKDTFEYCGRKDTTGHFRAIMLIDEQSQSDIEAIFGKDYYTRHIVKTLLGCFTSWLKRIIFDPRPENDESHSRIRYKE